jgi:hypothetical protein
VKRFVAKFLGDGYWPATDALAAESRFLAIRPLGMTKFVLGNKKRGL